MNVFTTYTTMLRFNLKVIVQLFFLIEICMASNFLSYSPFQREAFVKDNGYPFEIHTITTTDGYIIDIDRIPYGKESVLQSNVTRPAVLLESVGCADSSIWLAMGPNRSMPFLLADRGFDVWIGNYRGSTFGRKHVNLFPNIDRNFWDFTYQEYGIYDLRNTIDFILKKTGQSNLTYISHSLGASSFLVLVSEIPEYNSKIKLAVLYGPVVYLQGSKSIYSKILKRYEFLEALSVFFNINEVFRYSNMPRLFVSLICHPKSIFYGLCSNIMASAVGYSGFKYNIPLIASAFPGGLSTKMVWTLAQQFQHVNFSKYDYGAYDNMVAYGQSKPPLYTLGNVKVPVILYQGGHDSIVSYKNVERLAKDLPNTIAIFNVSTFDHVSFLWAGDYARSVYMHTISLLLLE